MDNYTISTYGQIIADQYDSLYSHIEPNLIDRLYELSSNGKVLELGIGTGSSAFHISIYGK